MIDKLIKKNILRNKVGAFLIAFPIMLVVLLFVSTVSIMGGVSDAVYDKYEGQVYRTLLPVFINELTSDKSFHNNIAKTRGVYSTNPALFVEEEVNGEIIFVKHVLLDFFIKFNDIFDIEAVKITKGRIFNNSDEVIVDSFFAKSRKIIVDNSILINGENFTVVGIYEPWRGVNPPVIILDLGHEYNLVEFVIDYTKYDLMKKKILSFGWDVEWKQCCQS